MRTLGLLFTLVVSSWANASQTQSACDDAADKQDFSAILNACHEMAVAGDAHAYYLMGYATLATKTDFLSFSEGKSKFVKRYSTDQLIALGDAKDLLKNAAEQGHIAANGLLGSVMLNTMLAEAQRQPVNINEMTAQAYRYIQIAADAGNESSMMQLADASVIYDFDQPNKVTKVREEFLPYLHAVVADPELNTPHWQALLRDYEAYASQLLAMQKDVSSAPVGDVLQQAEILRSSDEPAKVQQGIMLLQQLSDKGVGDATYQIAAALSKNAGKDKALAMMEKAAIQSNNKAMLWLGDYHGCNNAPKIALEWYQKAKKAGNKDADFGINEIKQYGNVADCS